MQSNHQNAYANRGEARYYVGHVRDAISDYNIVLRRDAEAANAWYNRGVAHTDLLNYTEALFDLEKALSLDHPGAAVAIKKVEKAIEMKKIRNNK